jgi:hypothetical protein
VSVGEIRNGGATKAACPGITRTFEHWNKIKKRSVSLVTNVVSDGDAVLRLEHVVLGDVVDDEAAAQLVPGNTAQIFAVDPISHTARVPIKTSGEVLSFRVDSIQDEVSILRRRRQFASREHNERCSQGVRWVTARCRVSGRRKKKEKEKKKKDKKKEKKKERRVAHTSLRPAVKTTSR